MSREEAEQGKAWVADDLRQLANSAGVLIDSLEWLEENFKAGTTTSSSSRVGSATG